MSKGTLLERISDPSHLKTAWKKLNKSRGDSRGLSSETIKQFQDQLEVNIDVVSKSLRAGTYKFQKTRGVLIPKANKKEFRPLRIPDVRDRLVAKAASIVLDEILTPKYNLDNPCSFAYRKDRGVHTAIGKMIEHYRAGKIFILEADIEKFFDNVNRESLLRELSTELPDKSLDVLLHTALIQEIGNLEDHPDTAHYFEDSNDGIPQGNCLSPLLANVYLSAFDARMQAEGFALVRYADDFIVMCSDLSEANRALQIAKEELEQNLPLKVHPLGKSDDTKAKTRIVDPRFHPFHFLSIGFDGRELWVHRKKVEGLKEKLLEACGLFCGVWCFHRIVKSIAHSSIVVKRCKLGT